MKEESRREGEALRAEVEALRGENQRLRLALEARRRDEQWELERQAQVEAELAHLVRLRVVSQRLHETLDPRELVAILQDLVVNLVGSEMLGIFELEPGGPELVLRSSVGIDAERFHRVPLEDGPLAHAARSGALYLVDAPLGKEEAPLACVPLRLGHRVLGMLVLFGMLSHKPRLRPEDRELLELLAAEGARALFCARGLSAGAPS